MRKTSDMWPYWMLFLLPAFAATISNRPCGAQFIGVSRQRLDSAWLGVGLLLALMIGYRYEVGGDWLHYIEYVERIQGVALSDVFMMSDPGFQLVNWLSVEAGWGIFGVNLVCGGLFAAGVVGFCQGMPRPWLALAVAVPYMVIGVAMGYSRQGVALGLAMLGLVALVRGSTLWFVVWVVLGATFHKTAVLLLPIAALASSRNRLLTVAWVGLVSVAAYGLLLQESVDSLYSGYIDAGYQSEGALIRLLMNAVPATILLLWRKRFCFNANEASLWLWCAIISMALLGVLFVSPSSTAVDRIALYMLPLQMVVFSHFPDVFGKRRGRNQELILGVLLYYAMVLFVWLNYANHSQYWLPYRFYPLELL